MPPNDSKDRLAVLLFGLLAVVCVFCDFFMATVMVIMPGQPMPFFPLLLASVGCIFAQGCLLAAWLSWGDGPFWQRFTRHWIVAAILYLVWAAGLSLSPLSQ